MKKVFITYGDEKFRQARDFSVFMARRFGKFDEAIAYSPKDVDDLFKAKNAKIFSYSRGAGLWLWKPYIINKALNNVAFGDIIFYCDAGAFIFRNVNHIIKSMTGSNVWVCDLPLIERNFTKPLCFAKMGCEDEIYTETPQRVATFLAIRKSNETMTLVSEWLRYCQYTSLMSPEKTYMPYMAHREDQSILSLLTKKYKIKAHYDPGLGGLYPELNYVFGADFIQLKHKKEYPVCMVVHKQPVITFSLIFKETMKLICPSSLFRIYIKRKLFKITPPERLRYVNATYSEKYVYSSQSERRVA